MAKRNLSTALSRLFTRNLKTLTRNSLRAGALAAKKAVKLAAASRKPPAAAPRKPAVGAGHWTTGVALGPLGMRRARPDQHKLQTGQSLLLYKSSELLLRIPVTLNRVEMMLACFRHDKQPALCGAYKRLLKDNAVKA